jgi:hypothetical protein
VLLREIVDPARQASDKSLADEAMKGDIDSLSAADPEEVRWNKDRPVSLLSDRCKDSGVNGLW